jgi:hypothetical protein
VTQRPARTAPPAMCEREGMGKVWRIWLLGVPFPTMKNRTIGPESSLCRDWQMQHKAPVEEPLVRRIPARAGGIGTSCAIRESSLSVARGLWWLG